MKTFFKTLEFLLILIIAAAIFANIQKAHAAVAYRSSGTFTTGAGTISPPYPADMVANDICLLAVESENQAISLSTAQGFAEVPTWSPQFAGTAATNPASRLAVFWKRTVGGDTAPTVADSGNHQTGQIHCFSGVITSGNPWDIGGGGNDGGANDTTGNVPGAVTTVANTLVVLIESTSFNGNSTVECSGWTNADLANITGRTDNSSTIQLGGGHCMATGNKATVGSYATTTVTMANTTFKGAISLALQPPPVSLTFTVDTSSVFIGSFTPGTPISSSTVLTVNTNSSTGYNISINRASTTPTLFNGADTIPDTPNGNNWTAPAATSTAGPSALWTSVTKALGFRAKQTGTVSNTYSTIWWGADDTSGNARYSGISTSTAAQKIANTTLGSGSSENTVVEYRIDVSTNQKSGAYTSSPVTYTVIANP